MDESMLSIGCRRGSRTAHDAVSLSANEGGQPQSRLNRPAYTMFILLSSPPRQEGTAASFVILQGMFCVTRRSNYNTKVR